MDKISHIIPQSPRVASVDLKESAPVRSGAPSFGGPVADASLKDRVTRSAATQIGEIDRIRMEKKAAENENRQIIENATSTFFNEIKNRPPRDETVEGAVVPVGTHLNTEA